jgi:hypothetical protein
LVRAVLTVHSGRPGADFQKKSEIKYLE